MRMGPEATLQAVNHILLVLDKRCTPRLTTSLVYNSNFHVKTIYLVLIGLFSRPLIIDFVFIQLNLGLSQILDGTMTQLT